MSEASPRFRQDLTVSPTEADGVACVDVRDPKTGASFRLYDFEYQLALQLNGQPVAGVMAWASKTYGADLTAEGIGEFAARLGELGFLEAGTRPAEQSAPSPARASAAAGASAAPPAMDAAGPRAPMPSTVIRSERSGSSGREGASPPAPAPAEPAPALDDASDGVAAEWESAQAAKTAQFVPDLAMLDSAPEPTPVVPLDLLKLTSGAPAPAPEGAPTAIHGEVTAQALVELPSAALESEPVSAPAVTAAAAGAPKPERPGSPSWATDLDGALQSSDSPPAVRPPPPAKDDSLPPLPIQVAPPPPGLSERRQPPAPEGVMMAAFSEGAAPDEAKAARSGRAVLIAVLVLVAAAAGIGYWALSRQHKAAAPQALHVRVMSPAPTAVYRWFSGRGQVTDYETTTLAFTNPGRLAELLPAGTEIAAGDVVAKLQGASGLETLLAHDRSRVGFYKQLRDSMRAAGNNAELRQAELHLVEKQKLVEMALAALTKYTVAATEPGEVVETLAKIGTPIAAGAPVARVKGRLLHGAFELDGEERATLAKMDFCRVEVIGLGPRASNDLPRNEGRATAADMGTAEAQGGPRFVDCKPPGASPAVVGRKVEISLPGELGLVSGQPLRLARRRFDAVFPIPAAAVVADGERRSVWIAGHDGTAELREVTVIDASEDALVSDGLRVGDQVIVDPPAGLRPGSRIAAAF